jgi:branched-chain amino acid transport system permease protein
MLAALVPILIGGILQGGIYALGAFGLSIIFGVQHILNVAHGDVLMLGGLLTYWLVAARGLSPFTAFFIVLPLFFFVGVLFQRTLIRPIASKSPHEFLIASILVTLGVSLAVSDITSASMTQPVSVTYPMPTLQLAGLAFSSVRLLFLAMILALTGAVHLFLRRTFLGRGIRAVIQNREGAMLVGVNIPRVSTVTFGVGTALTAVAGTLYVVLLPVDPHMGIPLTMKYLAIVVLGGVGNLVGALSGSMILGLAESLVGFTLGAEWSLTVAFFLLVVILLVRPRGLFG